MTPFGQSHWVKALALVLPLVLAGCKGKVEGDGCQTEVIKIVARDLAMAKVRSKDKVSEFKEKQIEKMGGKVIFKNVNVVCKKKEAKKVDDSNLTEEEKAKKAEEAKAAEMKKKKDKKKKSTKPPPVPECSVEVTYCPMPEADAPEPTAAPPENAAQPAATTEE